MGSFFFIYKSFVGEIRESLLVRVQKGGKRKGLLAKYAGILPERE